MKKALLLLSLASTMMFASTGAELTKNNCASCHMLTTPTPDMIPTMKAPAMDAVMFHINLVMQDKKEIKDFKAKREAALGAKDRKLATRYRRKISRLKKRTRRAA